MNNKFVYIFVLIISCFVSAISQVLLKKAALKEYPTFMRQYLNVRVVLAYFMFFAVVVANTYVLRFIPMTVMNPISETLPYVLSIIFGRVFFGEKLTIRKMFLSWMLLMNTALWQNRAVCTRFSPMHTMYHSEIY